jgi:hypothetical protein
VTLVTPGVLNGLKERVQAQRVASQQGSEGRLRAVDSTTYYEMLREGLVDWAIRTAADEDYELRGCAQCGKWFEPTLRARSRFCSVRCRKSFNNFRNGSGAEYADFVCSGCGQTRSMEKEYAGLRFLAPTNPVTPLRIARYSLGVGDMCCVDCVRTTHKQWRRYIAPMESFSERVSS